MGLDVRNLSYSLRNSPYRATPFTRRRHRVQSRRDLAPLGKNKQPFWFTLPYGDFTAANPGIQPQVTQDAAFAPTGRFIATKILAFSTVTAEAPGGPPVGRGFRTQLRQIVDQNGNGFSFSRVGIEQANFAGRVGADGPHQAPFVLPIPYPMPEQLSMLNRTVNKGLGTDPGGGGNTIQICVFGYRDGISDPGRIDNTEPYDPNQ